MEIPPFQEEPVTLDLIHECTIDTWELSGRGAEGLENLLEAGHVLYCPRLGFPFEASERVFLSDRWADGKAKHISFRGLAFPLSGARGGKDASAGLKALLTRYAEASSRLVEALFPRYAEFLRRGFTSYRTAAVAGRRTSWRKDDSRLHVDSFPSNPTGGARLLRVFSNVNPQGLPRVWRVGEPFECFAAKFFPKTSKPWPGSAWVLETLGLTKSRRSLYDHYMGQLHDRVKADLGYQRSAPQQSFAFPAGSTWLMFSDQVLHAAMAGQFLLEQTFYLDPDRLIRPELAPLRILERLAGRALVESRAGVR